MPDHERAAEVLQAVDDDHDAMVEALAALVRIPSLTGSDAEHEALAAVAADLVADGLDVDLWQLPAGRPAGGLRLPGRPRSTGTRPGASSAA